jgi:V-type H+-transporting ATPase subunit a
LIAGTGNEPTKEMQDKMYGIALALLGIVMVCIPLMLLVKPLCCRGGHAVHSENEIEFAQIQNDGDEQELIENQVVNSGIQRESDGLSNEEIGMRRQRHLKSIEQTLKSMTDDGGDHSFGEVFIHQMIETIEFVLGTVSNTASYLRLWALSLAHSQLAEVFFNLSFKMAMSTNGGFVVTVILSVILWPAFWGITFFVLMCMDCLECTLHTLRLHWVEFQNKFYKGLGYEFKPYNYKRILVSVLDG